MRFVLYLFKLLFIVRGISNINKDKEDATNRVIPTVIGNLKK